MTPDRIARLINRRNKLTARRDGRLNRPALDEIDALLREVEPGTDNRVDLALGRQCATLPPRPDYHISAAQAEQYRLMSEGRPDGICDEYSSATEGHW